MNMGRIRSIVFCGRTAQKKLMNELGVALRAAGFIVDMQTSVSLPELLDRTVESIQEYVWRGALARHHRRIDMADAVLVINPTGDIGRSSS